MQSRGKFVPPKVSAPKNETDFHYYLRRGIEIAGNVYNETYIVQKLAGYIEKIARNNKTL